MKQRFFRDNSPAGTDREPREENTSKKSSSKQFFKNFFWGPAGLAPSRSQNTDIDCWQNASWGGLRSLISRDCVRYAAARASLSIQITRGRQSALGTGADWGPTGHIGAPGRRGDWGNFSLIVT